LDFEVGNPRSSKRSETRIIYALSCARSLLSASLQQSQSPISSYRRSVFIYLSYILRHMLAQSLSS